MPPRIRPLVVRCTVRYRIRRRRHGRLPHRAHRRRRRRAARPRRHHRRGRRRRRRQRPRSRRQALSMRARHARRSLRSRATPARRRRRHRRTPVGLRRRVALISRRGGAAARSSLTNRPRSSRPRIWPRPGIRRSAMAVPATSSTTRPNARRSRVGRRHRRPGRPPDRSSRCSVAPWAVVSRSPAPRPTVAPPRNPRKSSPRIDARRPRGGARRCRR